MNIPVSSEGTILIVDDLVENLAMLGEILERAGYRVRPALSGELALKSLAASSPDLILLDIRMPGMDGYATCRQLKADPNTQDIPVIFISATRLPEDQIAAFEAGGVDYISKPFREEEVLARVRTHVHLHRMRQHLEKLVSIETQERIDTQARLAQSLACAELAAWDWDVVTGRASFNARWAEMRGLRLDEVEPHIRSRQRALLDEDVVWLRNLLQEHFAGRSPMFEAEYRVRTRSGSLIWILDRGAVTRRDAAGNPLRMLGIEMDISERKSIEEKLIIRTAELADSEEHLRRLSVFLQRVREQDRAHFARELHDELGQNLTALRIDFNRLEASCRPSGCASLSQFATIDQMISSTVDAVRRICEDLRPGMLDDLGLEAALVNYTKRFARQFGVACDLELDREDYGLDDSLLTAIFRIVQESLTNTARHARASHVMVSLEDRGEDLLLIIADDGCGLPVEPKAERKTYGLLGIRERVSMLGGTIAIDSEPGRGTHIEVSIPRSQEP